ncbi:hypothetical protein BDD12DRAFT_882281 [Trichophaea hybrida]|nr:hypothetical protein BDD12DRAFT_882281 [Trichophaea hybrida]
MASYSVCILTVLAYFLCSPTSASPLSRLQQVSPSLHTPGEANILSLFIRDYNDPDTVPNGSVLQWYNGTAPDGGAGSYGGGYKPPKTLSLIVTCSVIGSLAIIAVIVFILLGYRLRRVEREEAMSSPRSPEGSWSPTDVHDDDDRCISKERPRVDTANVKRGGWRRVLDYVTPKKKNPVPQVSAAGTFGDGGSADRVVSLSGLGPAGTGTYEITPEEMPRPPLETLKREKGGEF